MTVWPGADVFKVQKQYMLLPLSLYKLFSISLEFRDSKPKYCFTSVCIGRKFEVYGTKSA